MPGPLTTTTLAVDRIVCDGYGMCAELLPELIDLDDWGYPIISAEPVPPHLIERARRAVAVCPVLALRLRAIPLGATSGAPDRRPGMRGPDAAIALRLEP